MGGGAPTPPTPQSPDVTATNQLGYDVTAAAAGQAASNVNQNSPFASLTYNQTGTGPGGIPLYTANTQLSPQMQSIVNSLQGGVIGQLGRGAYDSTDAAKTVGDATSGNTAYLVGQGVNYLKPFYDMQTSQLDSTLRNQGISPMDQFGNRNPAYDNAMRALQTNQNLGVNQLITQFEPTAYSQAVGNYMLPLNVGAAEMGLINPGFASGSFINPPQTAVQPPNYTQAVQNYNDILQKNYQNQVQANSNMMSGLFGIPTAVLGGWAKSGGLQGLGGSLSGLFGGGAAAAGDTLGGGLASALPFLALA